MKKTMRFGLAALLVAAQLFAGCGKGQETGLPGTGNQEQSEKAGSEAEEAKTDTGSQVASEEEMAASVKVLEEGMEPVGGEAVRDGVYEVVVDSSSSMFRVTQCSLTVKDGKMTAVMTMGGTGYLKLFMGTGAEAVEAEEPSYIPFTENENGEHTFEIPVAALDAEIACTAFSKNKEKWYDRTLVFRADSLPPDAFAEGRIPTVQTLGLADGLYTVDVALKGGSGKAAIASPASLRVAGGQAYATVVWSSSNYDYMKIGEETYLPLDVEGNSAFEIPVSGFDWGMAAIADTIAMSEPHEITYTLIFDSTSIKKAEE